MLAHLNPLKLNKRIIVVILTVAVLAVAMFALTPGTASAGPATSPSACGTCAG